MKQTSFFRRFWTIPATLAMALMALLSQSCASTSGETTLDVGADNPAIRYSGRSEGLGTARVTLGFSGARIRLRFEGTSVSARIKDESGRNHALAFIDGVPGNRFRLDSRDGVYELAAGLEQGVHTVELVRITECDIGLTHFEGFILNAGAKVLPWLDANDRRIEFIGDSITCGYGVEESDPTKNFTPETENFCLGYAGLTVRNLDADYLVVSRSGIGIMRNYDGPREGSDCDMPEVYPNTFYLRPGAWDFSRFAPQVVCINLGTNDFSTTGCNVDKFVQEYVRFASTVLGNYPQAKLVVLQGPMDNSDALRKALDRVVEQLDKVAPGRVSKFEMSAQGANGFGADYHPSRAQAQISSRELTRYLSELMNWR
jgi:lysophospholipase L1-like esterase